MSQLNYQEYHNQGNLQLFLDQASQTRDTLKRKDLFFVVHSYILPLSIIKTLEENITYVFIFFRGFYLKSFYVLHLGRSTASSYNNLEGLSGSDFNKNYDI
jgi:hypothetical protein